MGGIMLAYYSIATNMALYLEQNELGGASLAGIVVAFTTVGGMITSLLLVQIELVLEKFMIPVMLFGMGVAFLLLSFTTSVPLVIINVGLVGFGQGSLFPIITLKVLDRVFPHLADRAIAVTTSFTFLGQFLSPIVLDGIGQIVGIHTIRFQYGVLSAAIGMIIVIILFVLLKPQKQVV